MSFDQLDDPLPRELVGVESRRIITEFFLENPDEYHRKKDIADAIDRSVTNVTDSLGSGSRPGPLVLMGVADVSDPEGAMPRYTLADTPVVEFLKDYDGYPLGNLFKTRATVKLTKFWVLVAEPDEVYTPNKIQNMTNISHRGFHSNIETFLEAGMIEKEEFTQRTEYSLIVPNTTYEALVELDQLIYETQVERMDDFDNNKQPA